MNTRPLSLTPIRIWFFVVLAFAFFTLTLSAVSADARQPLRGEGGELTQGFHVGNQRYVLDAEDPTIIEAVEFTLSGSVPAGQAAVRLAEHGEWYRCELQGEGYQVRATCDASQGSLKVSEVTALRVIATAR